MSETILSRTPERLDDAARPSAPENTDYDPKKDQEKVRSKIAYLLIAALFTVIAFYCLTGLIGGVACVASADCKPVSDAFAVLREFLGVALASITGLVGAVTGFYFGAQTAKQA